MNRPTLQRGNRRTVVVALALLTGVVAGLVVGGATGAVVPWGNGSDSGAARAAESTPSPLASLDPGEPVEAPSAAPLRQGRVEPLTSVENLTGEVALGKIRTKNGAVAAFTSYSMWLIGSPAAAAEPEQAAESVGGSLINPADARLLAGMHRKNGDTFAAGRGAYRVIGHAGDEAAPEQVMLEIAGPLTVGGNTRWSIVGGVVKWTSTGWQLVSIQPRDVPQPAKEHSTAKSLSTKERGAMLDGLGWQLFAASDGQ